MKKVLFLLMLFPVSFLFPSNDPQVVMQQPAQEPEVFEESSQSTPDYSEYIAVPLHKKLIDFGRKHWQEITASTIISTAAVVLAIKSWRSTSAESSTATQEATPVPPPHNFPPAQQPPAIHRNGPLLPEQAFVKVQNGQKGAYFALFCELAKETQIYVIEHLKDAITDMGRLEKGQKIKEEDILEEILSEAVKPENYGKIEACIHTMLVGIQNRISQIHQAQHKIIKRAMEAIVDKKKEVEWWNELKTLVDQNVSLAKQVLHKMSRAPKVKLSRGSYFDRMVKGKKADDVKADFPGIKDEFFNIKPEDKW